MENTAKDGKDVVPPSVVRPTGPSHVHAERLCSPKVFVFPLASVVATSGTAKVTVGGAGQPATPLADLPWEVPSFLHGGFTSEAPQEVAASLWVADEALKHLWQVLKEVGLSVEPSFKVCFAFLTCSGSSPWDQVWWRSGNHAWFQMSF